MSGIRAARRIVQAAQQVLRLAAQVVKHLVKQSVEHPVKHLVEVAVVRVIGQNVCPFWLVFLCGSGRFSCSSCMGGELEVGQNVCPEWPVRPCGTTVE